MSGGEPSWSEVRASGKGEPEDTPPQATALSYETGRAAPRVLASGRGLIAQRIIDAAALAGVPVRSDPALSNALQALDLGDEVPEELYRAVAETLAWAYGLDAQAAKARQPR